MAAADADVGIVGGGLAGALLALALRERGVPVLLLEAEAAATAAPPTATCLSYGVIPGFPLDASPLARRAAGAARVWQALQRCHGDLGWRARRPWPLPLPLSQVDTVRLQERLAMVLAAAGVEQRRERVVALEPAADRWGLALRSGERIAPARLVLAAGAGCLALAAGRAAPLGGDLAAALGMSWAGVLALPAPAHGAPYPLTLPTRFARLALEGRAGALRRPEWVVDAGLVPWGEGGLLGQLSWLAPGGAAAEPPPAVAAEGWLRGGLAVASAPLAALAAGAGAYRQVPVAFSRHGLPLAGRLPGGVWVFSGFRGAFAQVPVLAPLLAAALAAPANEAAQARRELQHLGVWPAPSG
jgi:glycine/D-amino acid oxidase-like deaminating enzyme